MANRNIQLKRNTNIAANANEAKSKIKNLSLLNGEIVIGTYATANNSDGNAKIIGVKANDKVFSIDNQTILDVIGIDDNGNVNHLLTGNTILKSIDSVDDRVDTLENEIEAISGGTSADVASLSGKTITKVIDSKTIDFTIDRNTDDNTKQISGDVKVSSESGNILLVKNDGLFTQVDYNPTTNALIINGTSKQLNAGSVIDSIEYSGESESLIINYSDTTGGTHSVSAPLGDLIEEYDFKAADTNHNVSFTVTRNVSGATSVQGEVNLFDCGEYD